MSPSGRKQRLGTEQLVPHLAQQHDEPLVKRHDVAAELLALCGQHAVDEVERAAAVEPERRRSHVLASARDLVKQVAQHGVGIKQGFHA